MLGRDLDVEALARESLDRHSVPMLFTRLRVDAINDVSRELGWRDFNLNATYDFFASDLRLDSVALSQRHGDELADVAVVAGDSIKPELVRGNDVVLDGPAGLQLVATTPSSREHLPSWLAGDSVDTAIVHLDRERLGSMEADPHSLRLCQSIYFQMQDAGCICSYLALIHGYEESTLLVHVGWQVIEVVRLIDREATQAWRQGVHLAIVRDANGAVEGDLEALTVANVCWRGPARDYKARVKIR